MNILLADSDKMVKEILDLYLKDHKILYASDSFQAMDILSNVYEIDLAVIDAGILPIGGRQIILNARLAGNPLPIILTSSTIKSDQDIIDGLESGADDYIIKPFNPLLLLAKIDALVRRQNEYGREFDKIKKSQNKSIVGNLLFDPKAQKLTNQAGNEVTLTSLESGIFTLLASNPGNIYSWREIVDEVWPDGASYSSFGAHISTLRQKISSINEGNSMIKTIRGSGYRIFIP